VATLFVSDVHLGPANPRATDEFIQFVDTVAVRTEALYILGDLFDVWLGDDDSRVPHPNVIEALARLSQSGVKLGVVHGNHDFLLGEQFVQTTGATLHSDPDVIELYGQRVVICHGDHLCSDDVEYQQWRGYSRTPENQQAFLGLPMAARQEQVAALRAKSRQSVQLKAEEIMDVNQGTVEQVFEALGVDTMIHGHTHRPALHHFKLNGQAACRYVLGDWYEQSHVLVWDESGAKAMTTAQAASAL
jgi:UDP-2,3-diacylglucosamine hydrolase